MVEFRNVALIIGINDYKNDPRIADLRTARFDAITLRDILKRDYEYDTELLTDENQQATCESIREALSRLSDRVQSRQNGEKVRLIFYFAGHGIPSEKEDGEAGYLVAQDAEFEQLKNFLPMKELQDTLTGLVCHHVLIILDCCFAGAFKFDTRHLRSRSKPEEISKQRYKRYIDSAAWQVITSAAHDQTALDITPNITLDIALDNRARRADNEKLGDLETPHSPFATALFRALDKTIALDKDNSHTPADYTKDGITTATELYVFLDKEMEQKIKKSNHEQVPRFWPLRKHDKGEFFFETGEFDPNLLPDTPELSQENNPYRGLESFDEAQQRFFYGRDALVEELQTLVNKDNHPFTIVLGVSGSGKSSLVKAGLIPKLRQSQDSTWQILTPMRPGLSAFKALAKVMLVLKQESNPDEYQQLEYLTEKLKAARKKSPGNEDLTKLLTAWRRSDPDSKLWLIVQKFEQWKQLLEDEHDQNLLAHLRQVALSRSGLVLDLEHWEELKKYCNDEEQHNLEEFYQHCITQIESWSVDWRNNPNQLCLLITQWGEKYPTSKLLLVIDQFEELLTLSQDDERKSFLVVLRAILQASPQQLRVVATLRADFESRFSDSEQLKDFWQLENRFFVRPMQRYEFRQVIEGPAQDYVLAFGVNENNYSLVDQLIDEVELMPGGLSLLSFTLSELYREYVRSDRNDRTLSWEDYKKLNGVTGSLTRRATQEYDALDNKQKATMRRIMLRMVTINGGGVTRRRVPEPELVYPSDDENKRVGFVIEQLVKARLIVKGQEIGEQPYIEPAHDFLVTSWGMLKKWIDEEKAKETLELQQRLTAQANDWARTQGPLLPDGDRLNRLERILKQETSPQDSSWLNKLETEFVYVSIDYRDQQNRQATEQRARTELLQKADRVDSLISSQALESLTLAIAAIGQNLNIFPNQILPQVQTSLHQAERIREKVPLLLPGHTQWITAIAFSPDSQNVISCSADGTVRLWDIQGNCIWQQSLEGVKSIAFSPDNSLIILGTNSGLYLDAIPPFNPLPALSSIGWFENYTGTVNSVAFSPDGQQIVSGGDDKTVRVWNLQGLPIGKPFIGHEGAVKAVAFSPDGKMIVSGGYHDDCTLRLWNLDGKPIGEPFRGEKVGVLCVAFHPDGQRIISGGVDLILRLWDISGKLLAESPVPGSENSIDSVGFSRNGQLVVSSDMLAIRLWQVGTNKIEQIIELKNNYNSSTCAFSPNGKLIASSISEKLYLWNIQDFSACQSVGKHNTPVYSVAFEPQGDRVFSISTKKTSDIIDGETVEVVALESIFKSWDIGFNYTTLPFNLENEVDLVKVSPDGRFTVTQTNNGETVQLWNLQGEPISQPLVHQDYVNSDSTQLSRDGQHILTVSAWEKLKLWDIQGNLCESFYTEPNVLGAALSPNGQYIVSTNNTTLQLWDTVNNITTNLIVNNSHKGFNAIAFSPDGELFTCATPEHSILLWDIKGNVKHTFNGHLSTITSIVFSPDGEYFVSSSCDETIRLWDIHGNSIGQPLRGHQGNVWTVAFSPDGQYIVSGGEDKTVRLWKCHWREWLKACCDHLYYHPVFQNPKTIEDQEQRQIAIAAYETCQKYVWSKSDSISI